MGRPKGVVLARQELVAKAVMFLSAPSGFVLLWPPKVSGFASLAVQRRRNKTYPRLLGCYTLAKLSAS